MHTYGELWRELARRGWGLKITTAFFLGSGTIGLEVVLDAKDGLLRAEVVHHEELEGESGVLDAAERLMAQAGG